MVQPNNYMLPPQPSAMESVTQGLQIGFGMQQMQQQRAAQEAAAAQQAQMNAELMAASRDVSLVPGLMVRYPQLAEKLKHGQQAMTEEQNQAILSHGGEVLSALTLGRADVAAQTLRSKADALRNSGDERGAQLHEAMAQAAEQAPEQLRFATALRLAAIPGGDKVIESLAKLGAEQRAVAKAPAEQAKAEAEASTAQTTAKYAERTALADLEAKGWNIKKIQADIASAKEQNRIAAMNAAISREGNDLKKQELRIRVQEAQNALDEKARGRVAELESATFAMDNLLNTIERVKGNKSLDDVLGSIEGRLPAIVTSGMDDEESDAIAQIEQLGSQTFLSQIPLIKGTGNLSNAEGDKLQASLQNLTRAQSPVQFRASLDEAARLVNKARVSVQKRYGGNAGKPDTPAAPGARPPLDSFFNAGGG